MEYSRTLEFNNLIWKIKDNLNGTRDFIEDLLNLRRFSPNFKSCRDGMLIYYSETDDLQTHPQQGHVIHLTLVLYNLSWAEEFSALIRINKKNNSYFVKLLSSSFSYGFIHLVLWHSHSASIRSHGPTAPLCSSSWLTEFLLRTLFTGSVHRIFDLSTEVHEY